MRLFVSTQELNLWSECYTSGPCYQEIIAKLTAKDWITEVL